MHMDMMASHALYTDQNSDVDEGKAHSLVVHFITILFRASFWAQPHNKVHFGKCREPTLHYSKSMFHLHPGRRKAIVEKTARPCRVVLLQLWVGEWFEHPIRESVSRVAKDVALWVLKVITFRLLIKVGSVENCTVVS
jgi:hypothetical protein